MVKCFGDRRMSHLYSFCMLGGGGGGGGDGVAGLNFSSADAISLTPVDGITQTEREG